MITGPMVASAAGHSPYLDALPSALPQIGEIDGSVAERRHVPILRQEDTLLQHRLVVTKLHHQSRSFCAPCAVGSDRVASIPVSPLLVGLCASRGLPLVCAPCLPVPAWRVLGRLPSQTFPGLVASGVRYKSKGSRPKASAALRGTPVVGNAFIYGRSTSGRGRCG